MKGVVGGVIRVKVGFCDINFKELLDGFVELGRGI